MTVEQRVKAASLYKFLGYVEWPADTFVGPDSPYVVAIAGAGEIARELARVANGRRVNNRPIQVRRVKYGDSLAGAHMLYIGAEEEGRLPLWLKAVHRYPILTVTEHEGALKQGSMINFRLIDDRVRFEVSLAAVEQSGVRISSRMLSVALVATRSVP